MKALLTILALSLALAGCACKGGNCKPCPVCHCETETNQATQWCVPVPDQPKVPCSVEHHFWNGESWEKVYFRSMCDPDCVDAQGVWFPGCQR